MAKFERNTHNVLLYN